MSSPRDAGVQLSGREASDEQLHTLLTEIRAMRAELAELHRAQLEGLRAIREALTPSSGQSAVTAHDAELLRLVAEIVGAKSFLTRQIVDRSELEVGAELRAAMHRAGAATPKALGNFFERIQGRELGGYRIERQGEASRRAVWRVWAS